MKKILALFVMSSLVLTSCSSDGPVGPEGPPGPQGPAGTTGTVIDVTGEFTSDNNYELSVDFNEQGVEVFESDAVLVYLKTGEDGTAGGSPVEVWRQLPQTYYVNGGQLQYNFDYTFFDVLIFLDGTVDFGSLDSSYTDNQVMRIVIVPADFAQTSGVDVSSMKAVMNALNVKSSDIQNVKLKK
ncbi:MAG: collagen-like protein [Gillisia sp.]